jgi:NACHT domain
LLPYTIQATFNSYGRQHEPLCLPDTRVDVLKEITAWANETDERNIFWLNGLAGTGKSTIARTIARKFYDQDRLGASFFFSRGNGDISHAGKFFTSIAVQLAARLPQLKRYICDAVMEHRDIAIQSLRDQWHQLVLKPLSKLDTDFHNPLLLVIDALDECDGDKDVRAIVQLFAETREIRTARLRIFMTSRPEAPVRYGFRQIPDNEHQDFVLPPSIVDRDIATFLEHEFRAIKDECALPADWPGEQAIQAMIRKSSGLFIWAATACRFISEGKKLVTKRLSMILEEKSSGTAPKRKLNEIYITVLTNSIGPEYDEQEKKDLQELLTRVLGSIVVLFSPLSTFSIAELLKIPREDVNRTLEDLHAILNIPKQQSDPIRLHHPSFCDFLLDEDRRGDAPFWVDEKRAHKDLADDCITLMSTTLKQNICDLPNPGSLMADVERSRVEQTLSPEVRYACIHWVQHLQKGDVQLQDNSQVHKFLQEHLLHWLESMSLIRETSKIVPALKSLESHIPVSHHVIY